MAVDIIVNVLPLDEFQVIKSDKSNANLFSDLPVEDVIAIEALKNPDWDSYV